MQSRRSSGRARVRAVAVLCALGLLLPACGSTVQQQVALDEQAGTDVVGGGADDGGLSLPGGATAGLGTTANAGAGAGAGAGATVGRPGGAAGPGAGGGGSAGTGGTAASGGSGSAGTGTAGGAGSGGPGAPGGAAGGAGGGAPAAGGGTAGVRAVAPGTRGITDDVIRVGLSYAINGAAANEAIGAAGISQGDPRRNYEVLIEYVNSRGGVAGRQLEPEFYEVDALTPQNADVIYQEECVHYTEDTEVYAVLLGARPDNALACYAQAGIPFLESAGFTVLDDAAYAEFGNLLSVNSPSLSSISRFYPPGLDRLGFFEPESPTGTTTVGLLTYDTPRFRTAVAEVLEPAMDDVGRAFTEIAYLPYAETTSELGATQAAVANAVLRFQTLGIDHVMILESGAVVALLFMQNAESQGYRPQYGLNTTSGPQVLKDQVPAAQMAGAVAVGTYDQFDVAEEDYASTPARTECERIFAEAGLAFADLNARGVGYLACDTFFSFVAAMTATGEPIDAQTPIRGLIAAGGFDSALVGPTRFSDARRDGASRYRGSRYEDGCSCFRAATDFIPIP